MKTVMSEEASLGLRVLVEVVFWLTFPVAVPVVAVIAYRQGEAEVRKERAQAAAKRRRKSDRVVH